MFIFLKGALVSLNLNSNFIARSLREWKQMWCDYALSSLALIYHNTVKLSNSSLQEGCGCLSYLWRSWRPYLISWCLSKSLACIVCNCNCRCTINCSLWDGFVCFQDVFWFRELGVVLTFVTKTDLVTFIHFFKDSECKWLLEFNSSSENKLANADECWKLGGSCSAFFVYSSGWIRGHKNHILIVNKQDDHGEIKGRKEAIKSTSPHFVVYLLCVLFLALKAVLDIQ